MVKYKKIYFRLSGDRWELKFDERNWFRRWCELVRSVTDASLELQARLAHKPLEDFPFSSRLCWTARNVDSWNKDVFVSEKQNLLLLKQISVLVNGDQRPIQTYEKWQFQLEWRNYSTFCVCYVLSIASTDLKDWLESMKQQRVPTFEPSSVLCVSF